MVKVALIISLIAFAVCLIMALNGILSDGLKGLKQRSKPIGISFLIYACWRREIATIFCREYLTNFCRKSRSQQNK